MKHALHVLQIRAVVLIELIGYFKSKTRTLLNQLQCKGDSEEWDDRNFNTKFLEVPSWTWGLDNN